jgi:hypothetical protein
MARLQDAAQSGAGLLMPHSPACWRWLVDRDGSTQWLVERDGVPVATGRTSPPEEGVLLGEPAAVDPPAAYALLHHALGVAGQDPATRVRVVDRPGTVAGSALAVCLGPPPERVERYYVRVADPARLLEHLRPVLSSRLAASPLAGAAGEAVITFFRSHVGSGTRTARSGRWSPAAPASGPAAPAPAWRRTWWPRSCSARTASPACPGRIRTRTPPPRSTR